ncbi:MAG: PKD domain-containing protein [Bacteroidota bacterium]|nr:PKD domain-containing protein [Bacteroidota bacterium]
MGTHIDTTFLADDGLTHTLGIPKNINFPHGNLVISNGTKINMCEGAYLLNRDSLILTGPAQTKGMVIPSCYGIDSIAQGSNNSMLVVSQASALVLNAGSKTFIKNGAAIYVKQNGSLIIKDGAYVQIGDSGTGGWGEIIVEAGGHVYIEPNAHIEYRRTAGDTADRNIFSIATQSAFAGVYFIMDSILKTAFILPPVIYPTPICSLDYVNPVKNKEWGYTNFAKPLATFQARKDTLCPGEPLYIKLNRILNDAQTQIKVCRLDSILLADDGGNSYWQDTCIEDSILVDLVLPDPNCVTPRITPEDLTYFFKPNSLNRVSISVINECGIIHDTVAYIFVSDTPKVRVSVPAMACEGAGTAYMRVLNKPQEAVRYAFELTELLDSSSYYIATYNPSKVYSYNQTGILPDTFYFTDYYFKGGRKYLASLSVIGACGSVDVYDTIHIPSGVGISLSKPKAYASPINGATSIQLNAHISVADSFRWEPTTWLNRTDTTVVISTPEDSIDYWLIAKYGTCTATDTVRILYNRVANAGVSDTLCYTADSVLLGNSYDMSIFLGCLYYIGGTAFYDMYKTYTHSDPGYFRYFTHFMMHLERINDWSNCGAIFLDNFKHQVYRRQIMNAPWFKEYYLNFMQMTDPDMAAFDLFVTGIDGNSEWQNNLAAQGDWGSHQMYTEAMFEAYNAFLGAHLAEVSCTWSKVENEEIVPISHGDEWFVLADKLEQSTLYIQQVITPEYAEIDEVLIYRDTMVEPLFVAAMQWDSTVFFLNYTQPESSTNSYLWTFGDGSANSTETNPMHTFAAFDSAFVVCLSATNKCGTYTYCDTVRVDSAGLTTTNFERPAASKNHSGHSVSNAKKHTIKNESIQLSNAPNPFLGSTQIHYQIRQAYQDAELIVTDVMGKSVYSQKIIKPIDAIQFNATQLPAGIYYYSILLDNNTTKTKMMIVL